MRILKKEEFSKVSGGSYNSTEYSNDYKEIKVDAPSIRLEESLRRDNDPDRPKLPDPRF